MSLITILPYQSTLNHLANCESICITHVAFLIFWLLPGTATPYRIATPAVFLPRSRYYYGHLAIEKNVSACLDPCLERCWTAPFGPRFHSRGNVLFYPPNLFASRLRKECHLSSNVCAAKLVLSNVIHRFSHTGRACDTSFSSSRDSGMFIRFVAGHDHVLPSQLHYPCSDC